MTDRTAPSSDARKRNAARGVTFAEAADLIKARLPRSLATPDQEDDPMTDPIDHRANAERALSAIDASDDPRNLPAGLDAIGSALLALHELLDERLPKPAEVKVAPFDPDLIETPGMGSITRNLAAFKHEAETPMREHGECCELDPADDLPGEPVEPGDLRAGDRVRGLCGGVAFEGVLIKDHSGLRTEDDHERWIPYVVDNYGEWCDGISDVRLIERAPREDEDPDEALARVIFGDAYGSHEGLRLAQLDVALMARKHIEAEQEDVVATLREEAEIQTARAEQAEVERAEFNGFWKEALADVRKARGERDALRERLDALRDDIVNGRLLSAAEAAFGGWLIARDDERAAKGEPS